jgi:hypothetical protein
MKAIPMKLVCHIFNFQLEYVICVTPVAIILLIIHIIFFLSPVTELCEYAGNVDVPIARESIRAVGKIALQQYDVNAIVDRLLQFLEMDKDYVTAETLVSVCNTSY